MQRLQAFKYELKPNGEQQRQIRLARYQRAMARKTKFGSNWKKSKAKITHLHQKVGNTRRDHLHKTTTTISQNHAMVCIEDLQVRNMSKSAAGNAETPGRNVKSKSGLWACIGRESPDPGSLRLRGVWLREQRRFNRRDQCIKGGTRPVSLSRYFA